MSYKNIISKDMSLAILTLPLACLGIYLSYFYFGWASFFYFKYDLVSILASSLNLSILIGLLNLICIFIIQKINYKLLYFYKGLLFSSIIHFIFHFIFRFSDLRYKDVIINFFESNNIFLQILFFSLPFFIGIFIYFFTKTNISEIYKFLLILILILLSLSLIRYKNIYDLEQDNKINYLKNDYKNLKNINEVKNHPNKKKVFFLLFDEFDNEYLQKNLDYLPTLKELISKSFIHQQFYTPAEFTIDSIPAIFMGSSIKKTLIKYGKLSIVNLENQEIKFNKKNSIFGDLDKRNLKSSIFGVKLPYCRVFNIHTCYDKLNFKKETVGFFKSIEIFLHITYISRLYNLRAQISKDETKYKEDYIKISKLMFENSSNFINTNTDFIYIHYLFPHSPGISDQFIDLTNFKAQLSDYEKNFFIVEKTISKIITDLQKYQGSLLIVTSDHWYKARTMHRETNIPFPAVFFAKIIGDDQFLTSNKPNNASGIKKLVIDFFDQKISKNIDIKSYFDNLSNHKTLMKRTEGF